jgi:hypothetical protein
MKKYILPALILTISLTACNNKEEKVEPATESGLMDATRNFIMAALKGDFAEAKKYMVVDSANLQYLRMVEGFHENLSPDEKDKYANASIIIESKEDVVKDSIAVVVYKNSYMNNLDTLRILHLNDKWLVDLKYLYEHDYDTLMQKIRNQNAVEEKKVSDK